MVFALLDPDYFLPDYRAEVSEEEAKELEIESLDEVREFVIVTIPPKEPNKLTANLLAPIIVNFRNRKLKQAILEKPEYQIRHPIINSVRKRPKRSPER